MINETNARRYCSEPLEQIENYDKAIADTEQKWDCHHRGEILPCGTYSRDVLKKFDLYFNRPASELIFLRHEEHVSLHKKGKSNPWFGKKRSDETRKKMSEAKKGRNHSEDHKRKISESIKRHWESNNSEETRKKMSEARKKYWERRRAGQ